jgi:hypothetical protein
VVFCDYGYEIIDRQHIEIFRTGTPDNLWLPLETKFHITRFILEVSCSSGLKATKDFLSLAHSPTNLQKPEYILRWAHTFATRCVGIDEAGMVIDSELQMARLCVERRFQALADGSLAWRMEWRPFLDQLNDNQSFAQSHGVGNTITVSGVLPAAKKGLSAFTLKWKDVLAEYPSITSIQAPMAGPKSIS